MFAISEYAQPEGRESRYAITIQLDSEGHEMDELDNNNLKAADDEREVESVENQRGEEIEVNEDR
ncbi:hypothetical protein OVV64_28370, partial [Klebsiella pneumoniae]|nr:hypothetical protein [Klebsiella pneumoniae]